METVRNAYDMETSSNIDLSAISNEYSKFQSQDNEWIDEWMDESQNERKNKYANKFLS